MTKLFYAPEGRLRATVDNTSYIEATVAWVAPRSEPGRFLSVLNGKFEEVAMVDTLDDLDEESRKVAEQELHRKYLHAKVTRIDDVRMVFGATYWTVQTTRGQREFVTQSLQENAQWIDPEFLLLVDVEGNQYHVKPISELDARSQRLLNRTV